MQENKKGLMQEESAGKQGSMGGALVPQTLLSVATQSSVHKHGHWLRVMPSIRADRQSYNERGYTVSSSTGKLQH